MNKLFVVYIGGSHEKSFIELHDMRFVVGGKIEDTYDDLRASWWGKPESLHLDCWGSLENADGYNIFLKKDPSQDTENNLYFVNLGGYDSNEFTELHKNVFVVAPNEVEAKKKAVAQVAHWESPHRDYLYEVENILDINRIVSEKHLHVHLEPTKNPAPFRFTSQYVPIGTTAR